MGYLFQETDHAENKLPEAANEVNSRKLLLSPLNAK